MGTKVDQRGWVTADAGHMMVQIKQCDKGRHFEGLKMDKKMLNIRWVNDNW